jgi:hypothetical protein
MSSALLNTVSTAGDLVNQPSTTDIDYLVLDGDGDASWSAGYRDTNSGWEQSTSSNTPFNTPFSEE